MCCALKNVHTLEASKHLSGLFSSYTGKSLVPQISLKFQDTRMGSLVQLCGIHQSFTIIPRFTFIMRSWYNLDRQDRTSKFTKTIWGFRSINVYSLGCFPPFFGVTWMNNSPLECPHASRACLFSMPYWILCATAGSNFKKGPSYVQDSQGAKNVF